jgi:hypothetical protein
MYVILGGEDIAGGSTIALANLGRRGFTINGAETMVLSGVSQGPLAAGDFDGDGARDLALGVANEGRLEAWVLYGGASGAGEDFVRGEVNDDDRIDLSDAVAILGHLFLGGAAPSCRQAADVNDSGAIDLSDAVYLLGHLFLGGPPPPPPFPEPGRDPTPDGLDC